MRSAQPKHQAKLREYLTWVLCHDSEAAACVLPPASRAAPSVQEPQQPQVPPRLAQVQVSCWMPMQSMPRSSPMVCCPKRNPSPRALWVPQQPREHFRLVSAVQRMWRLGLHVLVHVHVLALQLRDLGQALLHGHGRQRFHVLVLDLVLDHHVRQ